MVLAYHHVFVRLGRQLVSSSRVHVKMENNSGPDKLIPDKSLHDEI